MAVFLCLVPIINNFAAGLAVLALIFGIVGLIRTRGGRSHYRGLAIAAIIVSVVATGGVIASQAFYVSAIDTVSESVDEAGAEVDSDMDRMDGGATEEILKNDLTVKIGSFETKTDDLGMAESVLPVKITNKADEPYSYEVYVEAVDKSGDRIEEDWASSSTLKPGQSQSFDLFLAPTEENVDELESATFQVFEVSQY
ncbi:FxLYD domain-containing protein [Promicromonospora sukumoe]|uniref:FxLYD domain-containing protein n=1 Tax=Promicromonospora sukumoe TaxID=88382 RepID=UPI0012F8F3EC|nr:FxLYD domain-containing protein [Promicromonospora sukumoe]